MSEPASQADLVLELAEEFLERCRKGEQPRLREYIERHPNLAAEIKEVFPTMAMLENIAIASDPSSSASLATSAAASPMPRQLGDFRVIRKIGHGGMGVVYEAEQLSLGRHVALKVLPAQVRDTKQRLRFEREARAAARLHHTNIVPVFGVGEQDSQPYYVMQFIQGVGLNEVLKELKRLSANTPDPPEPSGNEPSGKDAAAMARSLMTGERGAAPAEPAPTVTASFAGPEAALPVAVLDDNPRSSHSSTSNIAMSLTARSAVRAGASGNRLSRETTYWQRVAQIGYQVASALEYAHKQGVLHRDIKPSNLLLDTDGIVWVTDFGLAKAEGQHDLTRTGDVIGTLNYMPPEAFDGRADARGDLYGLGLTLYELVALRRAFAEKDRHQLIKQVSTAEPPRVDRLAPNVPRDLATIIHTAIAREPKLRYQTASDLAADLQRFAEDRPILARRIGPVERAWRWSRRNPLVAALTAAVVFLLVAGSVTSAILGYQATVARDQADASAREAIENAEKVTEERNRALAAMARADREAEAARASMYIVQANAVQGALETFNLEWALELLTRARDARTVPDQAMGWEWHYHWRLCHSMLRTLEGHHNDITGLAVNPDGTRLVSCSTDASLREWDPQTGRELRSLVLKGFTRPRLAASADGSRLAIGSTEGTLKIIDAATWQILHDLQAHTGRVNGLAFSPDGACLATASHDRTVKIWSVATGQQLQQLTGHTGEIYSVAFSPDGLLLASGSQDHTVRLWNAATGKVVHTLNNPGPLSCVAFSPDGRQLACAGDEDVVRIWDPVTGREQHALAGHASEVRTLAFSPDGTLLASAGHDRILKLWDVSAGRERTSYVGHHTGLYCLAFSPDGRWVATGSSDKTIRTWSVNRAVGSRVDKSHVNQVRAVEFSPDGRWLASVGIDGKIIVRDVATGQGKHLVNEPGPGFLCVAFSPDSRLLASAGDAGVVQAWDVVTRQPAWRTQAQASWVGCLAFSPDGKLLASGSNDRTIQLFDAATGQAVRTLQGHGREVHALAFSADSRRLFSGSRDDTIRIWDADTGQSLKELQAHHDGVIDIALSRDNQRLASTGNDRLVKLWDLQSGRVLHTLTGHNDVVFRARFIGDGARLVSVGFDQSVRVWDTTTGLKTASLKGHTDRVLGIAVSPDGGRLASAGGKDLMVQVWDGRPLTDAAQLECEAVDTVSYLFSRPLRKSDVIAYLQHAPSLRPALRKLTVELAERYAESADARSFHDAAWRLVKHAHANATMCQFALAQMTAACELAPEDVRDRTGIAAAQYRLGRFQKEFYPKAMATLSRCDVNDPAPLAILAMTQYRLGDKEKARASLARLREVHGTGVSADFAELVHEADLLINAKPRDVGGTP